MLGEAMSGQKKWAEAEPLLVQGYEGLSQRASKIPNEARPRLTEALERLVHLYESTGKREKAIRVAEEARSDGASAAGGQGVNTRR